MFSLLSKRLAAVAAMAALLLGAVAAPAQAAASRPGPAIPYRGSNSLYTYQNWGGIFFKPSHREWNKPDGWPQVFVIGTDSNMWTAWSTPTATSSWTNLGGNCGWALTAGGGMEIETRPGAWNMVVNCKSLDDNQWWHRTRYSNGGWDAAWIIGYKGL